MKLKIQARRKGLSNNKCFFIFILICISLFLNGCVSARMSANDIDGLFMSGQYDEAAKKLEEGIEINLGNEIYKTKPCKIKKVREKEIYVSMFEGKKRQIRKMFDAIGNMVFYLRRVSIGGLQLGNLKSGEIKPVAREEIIEKLNF